ncbi:MAG: hypothetical protein MUO21_03370 [Nitrososphaeraceae archaeon]|nr:hypothetical protein [Nitrososphaeraceae archaeon]
MERLEFRKIFIPSVELIANCYVYKFIVVAFGEIIGEKQFDILIKKTFTKIRFKRQFQTLFLLLGINLILAPLSISTQKGREDIEK